MNCFEIKFSVLVVANDSYFFNNVVPLDFVKETQLMEFRYVFFFCFLGDDVLFSFIKYFDSHS